MDRDEMSNLYRGPSIYVSFQVSVHMIFHRCFLPSFGSFGYAVSEEKIFLNRPIRNKNYLWWPCLLMDRDKMSNLYRGPSIYVSFQVSVHMIEGFQRRILKCEKLTDAKWWQKLTLPLARWANNKKTFILGYHKEKNSIDKQQNFTSN